jgi:hypothetical protein
MSIYKPSGPAIQNFDFRFITALTMVLASGTLYLVAIDLPDGFTVTNTHWFSGSTALVNAGGNNHYWTALYDSSRNLKAQSTDNTAKAIGATALITDALSAPFTIPLGQGGQYYIGIMVNSGTGGTQPTGSLFAGASAVMGTNLVGGGKVTGSADSGLTTTAPNPAAAITQLSTLPYVGVS